MDIDKFINKGLNDIVDDPYGSLTEKKEGKPYLSKIIRLHSNENMFGVSKKALQQINQIAPNCNVYPEGSHRSIREKLASMLDLSPENFIVTNGGDELIYYTAMSFINDNDEVILPKITFSVYNVAYRIMRANIINSNMDELRIDLKDILNRINDKTKIIAVCNPNNPTGHAIEKEIFFEFIKKVPSNILVIIDEAYRDFVAIDDYPDSISLLKQGYSNILILRTFSKSYGIAGLRVGYGIAEKSIIRVINKVKFPFNISIVSQFAALGALEDKEFLEKSQEAVKKGREYLYRNLNELGLSYEQSNTNFILIHTGAKTDCIVDMLRDNGLFVLNTIGYGLPFSIRVTIGTQKQNELFINAIKKAINKC